MATLPAAPDQALAFARIVAVVLAAYAGIGVVFAAAFVARGAARIDHGANDAPLGFRVLIFPASAALWPLLLLRMRRADGAAPEERSAHRIRASAGEARR